MGILLRILLAIGLGRIVAGWTRPKAAPPPAPAPDPNEPKPWFDWTNDLKFEWYMQRRNGYSAGARDSYSRYDQTIAGVSAGAIVLSMTFLKDLDYTPESLRLLYASWIVFLIAGGASLYSLRTSADHDIEHLFQLEKLRKTGKINDAKAKELGRKTVFLNRVSLFSFVLGIFLIILFAFANYSVLEAKNWQAKEQEAQEKEGQEPPEPPASSPENAAPRQLSRNPLPAPAPPPGTLPKDSPATPRIPRQAD